MALRIRDVSKSYSNGVQTLKDVTSRFRWECTVCSALTAPASLR